MFKNTSNNTISLEQVNVLFRSSLSGGLSNIIAAWMIYFLVYDTQHTENALLLSISVTILTLIRTFITDTYLKKQIFSLNFSLASYILLTFCVAITWAAYEFMQTSHNDEEVRNIVFLINFGLIAGSVAILSVWLPAYLVYVLPQASAIFYVFITLDYDSNYFIAFTFLIFVAVMIATSLNINRTRRKEIELTQHNVQLISELSNEIDVREKIQLEIELAKQHLEHKVDERTKELSKTNLHLKSVIDKKEQAEKNLQYLAYHDELTGLPNKNLLVDRINQSIKISARDEQQMAILFLDLDRFKTINDSLGHIFGDKLLQEVASRLHTTLRNHDTISRNGGDEFVIVLEKLKSYNEAVYVANKIIHSLTDSFDIHSHKIHIGASIGISVYPTDGDTPLILLRNADTAMYRAKQAGGNQLQFYDPSMSNQLRDRLELENELHSALDNNEFYMVYQPQVSAETGLTIGVESLIRWNNSKHGEISPERFIPLLEETGLIYSVGKWVVKQVIEFIRTQPKSNVTFSINLSVLQCDNNELVDFFQTEVHRADIEFTSIEFEITETLLINDFEKTKLFLNKIHDLGCTIALDDFGTGYTSMTYLAHLPIDIIKIDKTLVRNIGNNNSLKSIVNAIVTMSTSLGKKNIFEGVETISELEEIKKMNGDIIQGYLYSKPLDKYDIIKWLARDRDENIKPLATVTKLVNKPS
jgi:diguanylate cyclase (GGDEF)-like protein